ncbi:signal peptide peptidase SppA [Myxococcota bacterium]|nr:signal peptide peptidase SppA [Myxococcota bacterium]MBU1429820.1 signal peptide peptidase SppA [Myxococcota bacterium]MBU1898499.1 signal peptide peptidase SppA [Myxococcota bacterium]
MSRLSLITWPLRLPGQLLRGGLDRLSAAPRLLSLTLEGACPLLSQDHPLRPSPISQREIRQTLWRAARDPRLKVILCRISALSCSGAGLYALREGLAAAKAAGKRVIALPLNPDTQSLWLASAASEIWLPPHVPVMLTGMGLEMSFYGEGLRQIGAGMDVTAAGRYKSAMEPYTRATPSPENHEALSALLDDLFDRLIADIAAARGRDVEAIRAAIDEAPLSPARMIALGLADEICPEERFDAHFIGAQRTLGGYQGRPRLLPRVRRAPRVALIQVHGVIREGLREDPAPAGATTLALCEALAAAKADRRVEGVILHIDSPGGSATASERIWRAVREVREDKPVVAFLDGVAASGGYYIASAADEIIATPRTLTGSIGVIASKPIIGDLLARLGVHRPRIERGARAGMFSLSRPYEDAERAALRVTLSEMYQLFLRRVAEGRGLSEAAVDAVGEGRVWTGAQALSHGLIDGLGDFEAALSRLHERAQIKRPTRRVILFAPRRPFLRRLLGPLAAQSALMRALDELGLGLEARAQLDLLDLQRRERILAWCPLSLR